MPETLFMKDGKFDFLTLLDKDYSLIIDSKFPLINLKVKNKVFDIIKERRKETT